MVLDSTLQTLGAAGGAAQTLDYAFTAQVATSAAGADDVLLRCTQPAGNNDADAMQIVAHKENN